VPGGERRGEKQIEAHRVYRVEENGDTVTVYLLLNMSWFGFENGVFTPVLGSSRIPVRI
jgi:hypothetical protein